MFHISKIIALDPSAWTSLDFIWSQYTTGLYGRKTINTVDHVCVMFDFMDVVISIRPLDWSAPDQWPLTRINDLWPSHLQQCLHLSWRTTHYNNGYKVITSAFFSYIRFSIIQLANDELMNLICFVCKSEGMRMRQIWSANLLQQLSFFAHCAIHHFWRRQSNRCLT